MVFNKATKLTWIKELIFQLIIHAVVFVLYNYDRNDPQIELHQLIFFLNYAIAGLIISYFLLPKFFYRKKFFQFAVGVMVIVALVIFVEEQVLEQIFFPDTRGQSFPGVIPSLLDVLPPIIILSVFKIAHDTVSKQRELDALKSAVQESELQFLKSQINPHFLFNNLNNLYSYALENSPKTPAIILELSSVLRYMLYDCKAKYVLLSKEIKQLENYTLLNELQIEDRGQVSFKQEGISDRFYIAPLILLVFIENAFKHSQASISSKIKIDIDISVNESGRLQFCCKNNYQEESNIQDLSRGIGLANVRKRLNILYPDKHQLSIREDAGIYTVDLTLQLHKQAGVEVESEANS